MRVDAFDFELPADAIALRPAVPRDSSRLLVVDPHALSWEDRVFADLPDLLSPGDILVFNDTEVIPARLFGRRVGRGGTTPKIEVTLHRRLDEHRWWAFARPARKLSEGDTVSFGRTDTACLSDTLVAQIAQKREGGEILLSFELSGPALDDAVVAHGVMPLPPYIASKREPDARDVADYQTIFARSKGAVAAPTAGLHFTPTMLQRLQERGVDRVAVTLHVGAGTFLPIKAHDTDDHRMHAEWAEITPATVDRLQQGCRRPAN